jgi:hypothetical protein
MFPYSALISELAFNGTIEELNTFSLTLRRSYLQTKYKGHCLTIDKGEILWDIIIIQYLYSMHC